jgi:sugar phosphate isomerase/epimerase
MMSSEKIGAQSYTYRNYPLKDVIDQAASVGCGAVEVWPKHLPPDTPDETLQEILTYCQNRKVQICGYGVVALPQNNARASFAFAQKLGVDYVSFDVLPDDTASQQEAVQIAEELGLKLALHNHGPTHHYSTPDDIKKVINKYPDMFGVCIDTGHFLRSNVDPVAAIAQLSPRIYAVHLKDFVDLETEVMPGTGRLDIPAVIQALRDLNFSTAYVLEYEADPENPSPTMKNAVAAVRQALNS